MIWEPFIPKRYRQGTLISFQKRGKNNNEWYFYLYKDTLKLMEISVKKNSIKFYYDRKRKAVGMEVLGYNHKEGFNINKNHRLSVSELCNKLLVPEGLVNNTKSVVKKCKTNVGFFEFDLVEDI